MRFFYFAGVDSSAINHCGLLKEKVFQYHQEHNLHKVVSMDNLLANIALTDEEVEKISKSTIDQWKNDEWFRQKVGLITASKAKRVFNAQCKLEKGSKFNAVNIVKDITLPKCASKSFLKHTNPPTNAREWGLLQEDSAREAYLKTEGKKHYKLQLISKGLLIHKSKPIIGASVDNLRTCKCSIVFL